MKEAGGIGTALMFIAVMALAGYLLWRLEKKYAEEREAACPNRTYNLNLGFAYEDKSATPPPTNVV